MEIGLNMLGAYDMGLEDEDGDKVKGIAQVHHIYKLMDKTLTATGAKKLAGPPPKGPIEGQLSKYLVDGGKGKASSTSGNDGKKGGAKGSGNKEVAAFPRGGVR